MRARVIHLLRELWLGLGGAEAVLERVRITGAGSLPSVYPVTELASASIGVAGLALAELIGARAGRPPAVRVDRRLASMWFGASLRPIDWQPAPVWDPLAGDYACQDGWIRLHTNAPHHRRIMLEVVECPPERARVARAVSGWRAEDLQEAVVHRGGCAAAMHTPQQWEQHAQGRSLAGEPVLHLAARPAGPPVRWSIPPDSPLSGVRVLDLTRVLAGPVATRFLAGFGAEVLRIDPPGWDEPALVPEVTVGKRCARLDLQLAADRHTLQELLRASDVVVHSYRADALEKLGFGPEDLQRLRPGLVDVALNAYGWTGPWRNRRGFDSLVQMSTGIAAEGMRHAGASAPVPLPVQALDQATGYLVAAATIRGLWGRATSGAGLEAHASLARTALVLQQAAPESQPQPLAPEAPGDLSEAVERTAWGPARRLVPPLEVDGTALRWDRPAGPLGADLPAWT